MLKKYINIKRTTWLAIFISLTLIVPAANNWNVPEDKKNRNSYIKFDASTASQGEAIYTKNCVSCHGNPGKGNVMKTLSPIPPELSSSGTQSLTDGELFYVLTTGRAVMPSFQNVLSEEERWKVISYIRTFKKGYVQTVSKFDPNKSKLVKTDIQYSSEKSHIIIKVFAAEKTGNVPIRGAEIALFAKRYFGRLQIEKTTKTDEYGTASFAFPKDIPGDKTGKIELIVKINDENYGEVESSKSMLIGVPTDKPALTAKRAIWGVLAKAPFWIIGLYSFGIICFLTVLALIIKNLRNIFKNR